jgi:predicted transcriptional regulator
MRMVQRIPLAKRWLSEVMAWQGLSIAATARKLRISDNTVRRYLTGERPPSRDDG